MNREKEFKKLCRETRKLANRLNFLVEIDEHTLLSMEEVQDLNRQLSIAIDKINYEVSHD